METISYAIETITVRYCTWPQTVTPSSQLWVDAPILAGVCAIMLIIGVARVSLETIMISCFTRRTVGHAGVASTVTPTPPVTYNKETIVIVIGSFQL